MQPGLTLLELVLQLVMTLVLESVHRRAVELKGLETESYQDQLCKLRGLSLAERRLRSDLITVQLPDRKLEPGQAQPLLPDNK